MHEHHDDLYRLWNGEYSTFSHFIQTWLLQQQQQNFGVHFCVAFCLNGILAKQNKWTSKWKSMHWPYVQRLCWKLYFNAARQRYRNFWDEPIARNHLALWFCMRVTCNIHSTNIELTNILANGAMASAFIFIFNNATNIFTFHSFTPLWDRKWNEHRIKLKEHRERDKKTTRKNDENSIFDTVWKEYYSPTAYNNNNHKFIGEPKRKLQKWSRRQKSCVFFFEWKLHK